MRQVAMACVLAMLIGTGCTERDGGAPPATTFTVRDSSGVEIVESARPLWGTPEEGWQVEHQPKVDIGVTAGEDAYELSTVTGALRLRDGRIVVAEFAANLKYFDSAGRHLTTLVRRGQGPGEGELISGLSPYRGDSILMLTDGMAGAGGGLQLANVLDADGRHGRQVRIAWSRDTAVNPGARWSSSIAVGVQGVLGDGSFIVRGASPVELQGTPGIRTWKAQFLHISPDGSGATSIARLPVSEVDEAPTERAGYRLPIFRMSAPEAATGGQLMYWGNGSRFEVAVFDAARAEKQGEPTIRILRGPQQPRSAGAAERERYIERLVSAARNPADAERRRALYEGLPVRPTLPAFRRLLTDVERNLWVEHYRLSAPAGSVPADTNDVPQWTVFDSRGAMLGDVLTPPGLEITSIGPDWILGIWADAEGVQHVRLHRLTKP